MSHHYTPSLTLFLNVADQSNLMKINIFQMQHEAALTSVSASSQQQSNGYGSMLQQQDVPLSGSGYSQPPGQQYTDVS